jgi:hypothetical protein
MSTQVQINDVPPKTQITATAGQTVFTTNWTANAASDVVVYARTSAQTPDDLTQLVSNVNYTVAFIGGSEIVEVTFLVARALGDVITITRDTPADRLNLYTNTNFTPSMLNQDVGILTLVDQQAQLYNNQVAPHYNVSATPDLGDPMTGLGGDIYLPVLEANQIWVKNTANTAIEAIAYPSSGLGIGWNEVTTTTQSLAQNQGYVTNNSSQVVLSLPTLASFGTIISIVGKGAGGWKVAQNAGQNIQLGSTSTTVGAAGYIESTNRFDSIELLCTTANTTWTVIGGPQGNITVA